MSSSQQLILGEGAGGAQAYQIERSLRFNSADGAYLNRTPAVAGNRTTWTWSGWVKRGTLSAALNIPIFSAGTSGTNDTNITFNGDIIDWFNRNSSSINGRLNTTQVFRDPAAWAHLVFVWDTTNGTSSNRMRIYVNGSLVTAFSTATYPGPSQVSNVNNNVITYIGLQTGTSNYFNGYLTEINFIDGYAYDPSYFGQTNASTGVWEPIAYTGTYGNNGFYLNFSDNSNITAATLGKDSSGNNNNWTPSGFSVTAGAANDSLVDTPTSYGTDTGAGGEVRGNYATLNPLTTAPSGYSAATPINGNLQLTTGTVEIAKATMAFPTSGKWYVECASSGTGASIDWIFGLTGMSAATPVNHSNPGINIYVSDTHYWLLNGTTQFTQAGALASSDIFQIAYDADSGKVWFGKNNTYYTSAGAGTGNPTSGTNQFATLSTSTEWSAYTGGNSGTTTSTINFGQRPFYTAPSGFKALCTQNLETPTIGATSTTQANDYFNVVLYPGTGSSQSITGVGFQPDFVWIKEREVGTADHGLYDAVRGVQKQLESNNLDQETTETTGLTAFGTDGFTVGALAQLNTITDKYVAWNWNAGGANATNTSGTITSTVRANTTAGFSIVTWTGNGASSATIGHGCQVGGIPTAPSMIIVKNRSASWGWFVYNKYLPNPNTGRLQLNLPNGEIPGGTPGPWNNTAPTSTVFSLGNNTFPEVNGSGNLILAYCFAEVAGYSAFGSYTGNGVPDGPFVFTGFRPRWILIKNSSATASWYIYDAVRNTFNVVDKLLYPNLSNAEDTYTFGDMLSNGFKIRSTDSGMNSNGNTIIYAAFAEFPFKFSLAR